MVVGLAQGFEGRVSDLLSGQILPVYVVLLVKVLRCRYRLTQVDLEVRSDDTDTVESEAGGIPDPSRGWLAREEIAEAVEEV